MNPMLSQRSHLQLSPLTSDRWGTHASARAHPSTISRKPRIHPRREGTYHAFPSSISMFLLLRRHNPPGNPCAYAYNNYSCDRFSHWSHDCSSNPTAASSENPNTNPHPNASCFAPYPRSTFTKATKTAKGEDRSSGQVLNKKERAM
ncbi:hypothetical protein GUJ93_ZPchr0001g33046 [Zizania palustris]|uniref:Uncharacterized protein n=1 Tax=Zizania palustris TaxID=103762 RepID=A0A8J5S965_ZIZPA|nr:hypothetical protein GUJ93_ZPchr0001g33046 [Zizania palustris]